MSHKAFVRKIPQSTTVVLCIHGIVGTPRQIGVKPAACFNSLKVVFNCVSDRDKAAAGMKAGASYKSSLLCLFFKNG